MTFGIKSAAVVNVEPEARTSIAVDTIVDRIRAATIGCGSNSPLRPDSRLRLDVKRHGFDQLSAANLINRFCAEHHSADARGYVLSPLRG